MMGPAAPERNRACANLGCGSRVRYPCMCIGVDSTRQARPGARRGTSDISRLSHFKSSLSYLW